MAFWANQPSLVSSRATFFFLDLALFFDAKNVKAGHYADARLKKRGNRVELLLQKRGSFYMMRIELNWYGFLIKTDPGGRFQAVIIAGTEWPFSAEGEQCTEETQ